MRASINGVVREAIIAACLTAIMILIFLGSWRSTLIIAISIPLSILSSIITLSALGETINIMTLGGLALAVGILVDDATVEIENINRNLEEGKEIEQAILDGAAQIAVPAFVSTLCICIVFVPMFFLTGVARYLFVPLAEAVVFAMLASYLLSRTIVPTHGEISADSARRARGSRRCETAIRLCVSSAHSSEGFEQLRDGYHDSARRCIASPVLFPSASSVACAAVVCADSRGLGRTSFPPSIAGSSSCTCARRPERASKRRRGCAIWWKTAIRREIPPRNWTASSTTSACLTAASISPTATPAPIGPADADILVSLADEASCRRDEYVHDLRGKLAKEFPGVTFYFLPADIVSQILNFGLPAPIDVQIDGQNVEGNREFADKLLEPVQIRSRDWPTCAFSSPSTSRSCTSTWTAPRRSRAASRSATSPAICWSRLSGSFQTAPTFWLNPQNGVSYNIVDADAAISMCIRCRIWRTFRSPCRRHGAAADSGEPRLDHAADRNGGRVALQHPAGDRYLRHRCRGATWAAWRGTSSAIVDDEPQRSAARNAA